VYDEISACLRLRKDEPEVLHAQRARYAAAEYPAGHGLYETGVVLRQHDNALCRHLDDTWWEELCAGSRRDQVALPFALYRTGAAEWTTTLPGAATRSEFFDFHDHRSNYI
jgi:hypothetical protein